MGGIMNNTIDQEVLIIGAGSSGICMGIQLKNAGIEDFIILWSVFLFLATLELS